MFKFLEDEDTKFLFFILIMTIVMGSFALFGYKMELNNKLKIEELKVKTLEIQRENKGLTE